MSSSWATADHVQLFSRVDLTWSVNWFWCVKLVERHFKQTFSLRIYISFHVNHWQRLISTKFNSVSKFMEGVKSEAGHWSPSNIQWGIAVMRREDSILLLCTEPDATNTSIQSLLRHRQGGKQQPDWHTYASGGWCLSAVTLCWVGTH